ncbi:MAG: hypothetical protein HN458_00005, partial [Euryarchaeota archaeon]|nr:hypothetical protein [Euryarchaeota archaeon]
METNMDTEAFINEIANRLVHYIDSKDENERVNPAQGAASLKRVLDVSVPLEGLGMDT